jgi:hypothetical protein
MNTRPLCGRKTGESLSWEKNENVETKLKKQMAVLKIRQAISSVGQCSNVLAGPKACANAWTQRGNAAVM